MSRPFDPYREFIPEFDHFLDSLKKPRPAHIRINGLKTQSGPPVRSLRERGIRLENSYRGDETLYYAPGLASPGNLLEYFLGYIHPQALTSCLVSKVLSPPSHAYVLDMCAAPGGKTAHMAQIMGNKGVIVANELHKSRHIPLGYNLDRLGVLNAVVTGYQAQQFPMHQRFDAILADVPCSGEGTFRQTGKKSLSGRVRERGKLIETQKRILLRGFDLLEEDGEMVYSTCTYNPGENESVVHHLLNHRDARLLPILLDLDHEPGLPRWGREDYGGRLRRAVRLYPHRVDSVGFFMARIGRA